MNVKQALALGRGLNLAALDVDTLLCSLLGKNRAWLIAHDDQELSTNVLQQFELGLKELKAGTPLAYILGTKEFWSLEFNVNPSVLIPRHDTEVIIETSLSISPTPKKILDLGTGSGVIAIVLALNLSDSEIYATDYSREALRTAQINAKKHGAEHIHFIHSHWYKEIPTATFDLILSNPPYIEENDPHLENLSHEPEMALVSGKDGLNDIRHIISNAPKYLSTNGYLMIEHGYNQAEAVQNLLFQHGFEKIESIVDLAGIPRVTIGKLKNKTTGNQSLSN